MREGSLEAPVRHPIDWQNPAFYDREQIAAEMQRVFEICHGCRRCFNLCDSFPRLFDLIDNSATGEIDGVDRKDYAKVADACTLCDLCFMTKCPYVPPHEFNVDFPHLMLRHRAAEFSAGEVGWSRRQIAAVDRNGKLASKVAPLANWAIRTGNALTRPLMEKAAGIDRRADLPRYESQTLLVREAPAPNPEAPAFGQRKAMLYTTCIANYNRASLGMAARAVLARNGVETELAYPGCCGMPKFEQGDLNAVAEAARASALALGPAIDRGYDVVALVPSCALMLKFEWPLLLPKDESIRKLAQATYDVSEYVVAMARKEGLAPGMKPLPGGISFHLACHSRAQNMGPKGAELLRLLPEADVAVIERCSGHGGSWGMMRENFDVAIKVGKPVARQAARNAKAYLASECPLAGAHIAQGIALLDGDAKARAPMHPIELMALSYGLIAEPARG